MNVALVGWYGCGNYGNRAIAAAICQEIRSVIPEASFEKFLPAHRLQDMATQGIPLIDLNRRAHVDKLNSNFDLVIFGGGRLETLFAPLLPTGGAVRCLASNFLKALIGGARRRFVQGLRDLRVPCIIHCVSFGGNSNPKMSFDPMQEADALARDRVQTIRAHVVARDIVPCVSDLSVRGKISHTLLRSCSPHLACDPVFALEPPSGRLPVDETQNVAVCVHYGARYRSAFPKIARVLDVLAERGDTITFVPMRRLNNPDAKDDVAGARAMEALMKPKSRIVWLYPHDFGPEEFLDRLKSFRLVITMRLHLAILAGMAGCAVLPLLAVEPKVLEVLDTMGIVDNSMYVRGINSDDMLRKIDSGLRAMEAERMKSLQMRYRNHLVSVLSNVTGVKRILV